MSIIVSSLNLDHKAAWGLALNLKYSAKYKSTKNAVAIP
jgi:hypothetical protein